jgi:hypothetical protein
MFRPKLIENPLATKQNYKFFNEIDDKIDVVSHEVITVKIDGEEYEECKKTSEGGNYWANSKPGVYGAGLLKTEEDPYKPARTGLLAEMAFSKLTGEPFNNVYKKGGDTHDFLLSGKYKTDVKCSTKQTGLGPGLIQIVNEFGYKIPLRSDIYIFSYLRKEDRTNNVAEIVFVGFALREDVAKCKKEYGYRGKGHINHEVPFHSLKPIKPIIHFCNMKSMK